jgi:FkbM family methyltransferase
MRTRLNIIGGRLLRGLYLFLTQQHFRTWFRFLLFAPLKTRYKETAFRFGGKQFTVPDALSFFWQYHEIMVRRAYAFPHSENRPPVIFDCGSNVGLSLCFYHDNYPGAQITAFEPDPKVAAYLEGNLERNGIQGVTLHRAATWISEGTLHFASEGADGGRLDESAGGVEVQTVNLRALIEQHAQIDFLKMDIEGAEAELVPHLGDSLQRIRHLFIEYHSYAGQEQALHPILHALAAQGFRYYMETDVKRRNPFTAPPEFQCNIFASRQV